MTQEIIIQCHHALTKDLVSTAVVGNIEQALLIINNMLRMDKEILKTTPLWQYYYTLRVVRKDA